MMFVLAEDLVTQHKETGDFDAFKLDAIRFFSTDTTITEEEFKEGKAETLTQKLYDDVMAVYERKAHHLAAHVLPVIKDLFQNRS